VYLILYYFRLTLLSRNRSNDLPAYPSSMKAPSQYLLFTCYDPPHDLRKSYFQKIFLFVLIWPLLNQEPNKDSFLYIKNCVFHFLFILFWSIFFSGPRFKISRPVHIWSNNPWRYFISFPYFPSFIPNKTGFRPVSRQQHDRFKNML